MTQPDSRRRLVAILRGIRIEEVAPVVGALIHEGFRAIEIPLNSPDPIRSIAAAVEVAAARAPGAVRIGAGTVLTPEQVDDVRGAGGDLIVSPNVDASVIGAARAAEMTVMPGVFTPTEAFAALASGADTLKFFPASILGPSGIAALKAVLPAQARVYAVGGVGPADFAAYRAAGCDGFGLGSALYKPGMDAQTVAANARAALSAMD